MSLAKSRGRCADRHLARSITSEDHTQNASWGGRWQCPLGCNLCTQNAERAFRSVQRTLQGAHLGVEVCPQNWLRVHSTCQVPTQNTICVRGWCVLRGATFVLRMVTGWFGRPTRRAHLGVEVCTQNRIRGSRRCDHVIGHVSTQNRYRVLSPNRRLNARSMSGRTGGSLLDKSILAASVFYKHIFWTVSRGLWC